MQACKKDFNSAANSDLLISKISTNFCPTSHGEPIPAVTSYITMTAVVRAFLTLWPAVVCRKKNLTTILPWISIFIAFTYPLTPLPCLIAMTSKMHPLHFSAPYSMSQVVWNMGMDIVVEFQRTLHNEHIVVSNAIQHSCTITKLQWHSKHNKCWLSE